MAVLKNKDGKELYVDCCCGCDNGIRFKIDKLNDLDYYCIMTYTNGHFYSEQNTIWDILSKKFKKIWSIIRNKDFYYAEMILTKDDFNEFRNYINSAE